MQAAATDYWKSITKKNIDLKRDLQQKIKSVWAVMLEKVPLSTSGPEVIKLTQLSSKFQLLIKTKIPKSEEVFFCLKSLRCGIYHANKC